MTTTHTTAPVIVDDEAGVITFTVTVKVAVPYSVDGCRAANLAGRIAGRIVVDEDVEAVDVETFDPMWLATIAARRTS